MMNDTESKKSIRQVAIAEGLFVLESSSGKGAYLIGGKCRLCSQVHFPKEDSCPKCGGKSVEKVALSRRGKVYQATVFKHHRPSPGYDGPIPYAYGMVELPEGAGILAPFTECSLDEPLKVGTEVELVVEKFGEDAEGNNIIAFKFRPI